MTVAQQAEVIHFLEHIVDTLYAESGTIPATEGGLVFREISSRCLVKEDHVRQVAVKLGYWPYTSSSFEAACSQRNFPVEDTDAFIEEQLKEYA